MERLASSDSPVSDLDLSAAETSEHSESVESGNFLGYQDVSTYEDLFSIEEWEALTGNNKPASHIVTINYPPGEFEGNDNRYELNCDSCGHIGAVDTLECAQATAHLHEAFVATFIEEVPA